MNCQLLPALPCLLACTLAAGRRGAFRHRTGSVRGKWHHVTIGPTPFVQDCRNHRLEDSTVRKFLLVSMAISGAILAATSAVAASDYFLKIEGVDGESTARSSAETIEVSSFSWGASQASVMSPRDAASGMATGKRQHKPMTVTAEVSPNSRMAAPPAAPAVTTLALVVAEPGNATSQQLLSMCASGQHIKNAVLTGPSERYVMENVIVSSCAVTGNQRKYEFTGHITLMK